MPREPTRVMNARNCCTRMDRSVRMDNTCACAAKMHACTRAHTHAHTHTHAHAHAWTISLSLRAAGEIREDLERISRGGACIDTSYMHICARAHTHARRCSNSTRTHAHVCTHVHVHGPLQVGSEMREDIDACRRRGQLGWLWLTATKRDAHDDNYESKFVSADEADQARLGRPHMCMRPCVSDACELSTTQL